jgi:hypothetical protein
VPEDGRDFYVGYRPQAPAGDAVFEFGDVRRFQGRIAASPHPVLRVTSPHPDDPESHLLVGFGKRGADDAVAGLDGSSVTLEGQRIYRGESRMIELAAVPIPDRDVRPEEPVAERSLGEHRLAGEIVDGKCHLGVMKPGHGKTHRACAARCISGGAPPMLWVTDRSGQERQFLLVGRDERQLGNEILGFVAEPVEVAGEVVSRGGLWILRTEPDQIRRLEPGRLDWTPPDSERVEPHGE